MGKPLSTCAFDADACLPLPWLHEASYDTQASTGESRTFLFYFTWVRGTLGKYVNSPPCAVKTCQSR